MSERSQELINKVWEARNAGADTEQKLVSAILRIVAETVQHYQAQNDIIVLDKQDMLQLAQEIEND